MHHIVIIGSPDAGFEFVGPFDSSEDALAYAEQERTKNWWVCELQKPE